MNVEKFVKALACEGVDFFCGVPDSLLKSFCAYVTDTCGTQHTITANEGGAVALASGHYLATGKPALVYMQNSGQGNAVNPLASLADPDVYSIPMVLLVGWRGEPGKKDEPQHVKQGKVTLSLFETLGIPTSVLPDDEAAGLAMARAAVARALAESRPVALVVKKGLFETYTLQNKKPDIALLKREKAIEEILDTLPADAVVVSTTGMISRELYETRERLGQDHSKDFLTVGSMGHALQIALGIALSKPDRTVWCFDGDGASIMHLGGMPIVGSLCPPNLVHVVFNNGAHDSVGGQPTVGLDIEFTELAEMFGYTNPNSVDDEEQLADVLAHLPQQVAQNDGPYFLEVRVKKGNRSDLGRPTTTPLENKRAFMEFLSND